MRFTESILAFDCWNQVRPWCLTASHRGVYHINCGVGILYMVIRHWPNSDWHMALIWIWYDMLSYSSNGNILRVTGHLCGDSPAPDESKASDAELWCFLWSDSNILEYHCISKRQHRIVQNISLLKLGHGLVILFYKWRRVILHAIISVS